jgi:nitric oxide dioxygenase
MTNEQIQLVQSTFGRVRNDGDAVAALFYGRLFETAPEVRPMFRGDMTAQGRKLMTALALAVDSLTRLDSLIPALESLGRKHVGYGVQDHHYAIVGEALLWTLEKGLGLAWTPEAKDAWATTYSIVASVMQKAAAGAAA